MGCDIHCFIEMKRRNGDWEAFREVEVGRSYATFAAMASVRGNGIAPFSNPRGLPGDVSEGVKRQYGDDYYHTPSYLSLKEILVIMGETQITNLLGLAYEMYKSFDDFNVYEDARVVFWFDN